MAISKKTLRPASAAQRERGKKAVQLLVHILECAAEDEHWTKQYSKGKLQQIAADLKGGRDGK